MKNLEQVTTWGALGCVASYDERKRLNQTDRSHVYYVEEEIGTLVPRYRIVRLPKPLDVAALVDQMRAAGHDHLLHYAGAAHRDLVAWQMCVAYLDDPMASESVLKSRALKAAHGWDVSPGQIAAASAR